MCDDPASAQLSVDDHRAAVAQLLGAPRTEQVDLDWTGVGRVLAEPLTAAESLPRLRSSAMDGFALRPEAEGQQVFPVVGDAPAGGPALPALGVGLAVRVMTGARVPDDATVVVPVEQTDATPTGPAPDKVRVTELPPVGKHIREVGEDLRAGALLAPAGAVLSPALVALGRSTGCTAVAVRTRTRVALVATGAELTAPGEVPGASGIFESNGDMLAGLVETTGARVARVLTCPDEPAALTVLLDALDADTEVDLVITTGGLSQGAYEVVRQVGEGRLGFEFVRVAMQPGAPQGLGVWGSTPVVCLPGTPTGAFTSYELFVRPALEALLGFSPRDPQTREYAGPTRAARPGLAQFLSGVVTAAGTVTLADGRALASLVAADVLIEVAADADTLAAGDRVTVHALRR